MKGRWVIYKNVAIRAFYSKKDSGWFFSLSNKDELQGVYSDSIQAISAAMREIDNEISGIFVFDYAWC